MHDKKDNFVVWGSAGHAKVLADIIQGAATGHVVALFDNDPRAVSIFSDVPLFLGSAFSDWIRSMHTPKDLQGVIAIGGSRGRARVQIAEKFVHAGVTLRTLIHPSASVSPSAHLGSGCQVLANSVVAAGVVLGQCCIVNNSANVDHECELADGVHIAPGAVLCGCVNVGEYTLVGANSVVLPRIRIGSHVIVGAGSVVTKDVPDRAIVVGNPAVNIGVNHDRE